MRRTSPIQQPFAVQPPLHESSEIGAARTAQPAQIAQYKPAIRAVKRRSTGTWNRSYLLITGWRNENNGELRPMYSARHGAHLFPGVQALVEFKLMLILKMINHSAAYRLTSFQAPPCARLIRRSKCVPNHFKLRRPKSSASGQRQVLSLVKFALLNLLSVADTPQNR